MKTIRWGIIGCGDVTEKKSGPAFYKVPGSQLVAVMRRDAAKAEDYARRHHVPRWTTDAQDLIDDPNVDAVYVATMPDTHEAYALKVAAAGKPCYVEKPLTRNTAEAQRMVAAFQAKTLPLYAAYYRRALPRFVEVKQLLDSAAIGQLLEIDYSLTGGGMLRTDHPPEAKPWRYDARAAGGGLFLDLGSHALDLLDHLLGPLQSVKGRAWAGTTHWRVEEEVDMRFETHGGARGKAYWNFASPGPATDKYVFLGTKGRIECSCFGNEPVRWIHGDGRVEELSRPNPEHVHQPLVTLMMAELLGTAPRGTMPSTGVSALRTQVVMDTVLNDFYGGREDRFWTRPPPGYSPAHAAR